MNPSCAEGNHGGIQRVSEAVVTQRVSEERETIIAGPRLRVEFLSYPTRSW